MVKRCTICNRKAVKYNHCIIHNEAYENLKSSYHLWLYAHDNKLQFNEYLDVLSDLKETGEAVKEIIEEIRSKEKR